MTDPMAAIDLTFDWESLTLAASLHLAAGPGPQPVVLMLQGSGPADRNSGGYFTEIRRAFLDRGLATLAFDKPGCGASSGDWRRYGLDGRAGQASAALDLLAGHPRIDADRIGIWGHSQGGWLVQMLAGERHDLAFAIASSGPSIGVAEQDRYGCEHTMRAQGRTEPAIERALAQLAELHQAARSGEDFASIEARLLRPTSGDPPLDAGYLTIEDAEDWGLFQLLIGERYEPLEALRRVRCPFLAVYGGLDLLVPAWRSAEESGMALRAGGNQDSTVVVYPGGDHRIQDPATAAFVPGYLDLLCDWAARRVTGGPSS